MAPYALAAMAFSAGMMLPISAYYLIEGKTSRSGLTALFGAFSAVLAGYWLARMV